LDRWFYVEEDVVTSQLPPRPTRPTPPAPSELPDRTMIEFPNGGSGSPQSGEISLHADFSGTSKYFGVHGQTADSGDFGFTVDADTSSTCKPRFVALNIHVHDETDVALEDSITIEVTT